MANLRCVEFGCVVTEMTSFPVSGTSTVVGTVAILVYSSIIRTSYDSSVCMMMGMGVRRVKKSDLISRDAS